MYQNQGNGRTLKPTSVTFESVIQALMLANDVEGVERVKLLRDDGGMIINNTRQK